MSTEYSQYTWLVQAGNELLGETQDFGKAQEIVRAAYLADYGWTEEKIGHRLGSSLYQRGYYLTHDGARAERYCLTPLPKL